MKKTILALALVAIATGARAETRLALPLAATPMWRWVLYS